MEKQEILKEVEEVDDLRAANKIARTPRVCKRDGEAPKIKKFIAEKEVIEFELNEQDSVVLKFNDLNMHRRIISDRGFMEAIHKQFKSPGQVVLLPPGIELQIIHRPEIKYKQVDDV